MNNIPKLNIPQQELNLKKDSNNKLHIFDRIRKKWLVLNPEEWVRQNVVSYLIKSLNYPENLIAVEKEIVVAGRKLRFDALVYSSDFKPLLIIEFKAPEIKITQESFDQILTYNYITQAPYLLVTNGVFHVACKVSPDKKIGFLEEIPAFNEIDC